MCSKILYLTSRSIETVRRAAFVGSSLVVLMRHAVTALFGRFGDAASLGRLSKPIFDPESIVRHPSS